MSLSFKRLPYLVLKNVLENMDFIELFIMAGTSQKMKVVLKRCIKIRNHKVELLFRKKCAAVFVRTTDREIINAICAESMDGILPEEVKFHLPINQQKEVVSVLDESETSTPLLITYWKNKFSGGMDIYKELVDIFPISIKKVVVNVNDFGEDYRSIIRWCNELPSIPSLIYFGNCDFQDYMWILENSNSQNYVGFRMTPKEHYEQETLRLNAEEVFIEHGRWVKLKHLQFINCKKIIVYDATLTDRDINEFLISLQRGSNPDLRRMIISFHRQSETAVVFEGLNAVWIRPAGINFQLNSGENCTFTNAKFANDPNRVGYELIIERVE